jgi:putative FmdB family regulatory protein
MPLYEFRCAGCQAEFEELVGSSAEALAKVECPACHSRTISRKLSTFATRSAGGGLIGVESSSCQPGGT